ncbi:RNA-dependent RNA polymerase [Chickpea chlorotic stunt virus]|uniref:RNA-dependent RNA polymerase n=1 Tax=Chickpea chlorotic stunt virus TaxID=328430 RepID=Q17S71_9VIRU|nr:RNA-dependent RNA polymerase [Chickpea chlorotic stunt virus]
MALTKVLAIALFCFCFHFFLGASSSLATNWSSPGMAGITAITGFSNDYLQTPGFVPYVYNLVEKPVTIPQSKLPLPELNYTDIFKVLWLKGYQDTRTCLVLAFTTSQSSLAHMYDNLSEITSACALRLSWAIVSIWTLVIWAFCSWMVRIITTHTMLIVAVGLLIACTVATAKLLHLIFGSFSVWIIVPVYRSLAFLWKLRSPKTVSNSMKIVKEKMTKGFGSYDMIMSPPKSCVLEMLHDDEQHCGYASCILLADGTVGLLTSYHVMEEAYWVKSNKTGNKIKTSDFRPLTQSQNADLSILVGPPNWQGLLGCSAAQYVTVKHLAAGDARIFYRKNGEWYSGVAKLVGPHKLNFVNVLSNTEPGFSGTPYFSGNKIVGVHTGGDEEENRNYMAAIPHLEGLTASKYIYETTAPKGRIFDEDLYQELLEEFSTQEARSIMKHKGFDMECSGKFKGRWVWIDCNNDLTPAEINNILSSKGKTRLESESPRFFEDAEEFYDAADSMELETSKKANFKRASRRRPRKNRKRRLHPKDQERRWRHCPESDRGSRRENECSRVGETSDLQGGSEGAEEYKHPTKEEQKAQRKAWRREQANSFNYFFASQYKWEVPAASEEAPGFEACGKIPQFYHPKQKQQGRWGEKVVAQHPEMGEKVRGFGWPEFGKEAELKSLRLQTARWLKRAESAKIPSSEERERVIGKTVEAYQNVKSNCPAATRLNELSWDQFQKSFQPAVHSLELDAGIGVPYIAYGLPTHRGWVENHERQLLPILAQLTYDRLKKMSQVNFEDMSAEELVQKGLCDPIRVFVKGEPHKQAKLDEGRYRLIMSVSLVDQLVARVLFQEQNKLEITLWRSIPSKPGMGLSTDAQVTEFMSSLSQHVQVPVEDLVYDWEKHVLPTDCSGFDWSVSDWLLQDEMEVRNRLTENNNDLTKRLRGCWLKCLSNSVLALSDGSLFAQRVPGVQKSGSYNTSSTNSRIRVMCAFHAGASWCIAMGDDALESVDTDLSVYKDIGLKVEVSGQLEFCSHIFEKPDLAIPVNVGKMLYKLIYGYNPECGSIQVLRNYIDACTSVLNELRHDPEMVQLLYSWLLDPVLPQN